MRGKGGRLPGATRFSPGRGPGSGEAAAGEVAAGSKRLVASDMAAVRRDVREHSGQIPWHGLARGIAKTGLDRAGKGRKLPARVFPSCSATLFHQTPRMPASAEADPRFSEFVLLQAQNAGLFLGQIPHPHSGQKQINLRAAQSVIDSLEMLVAKTRGNLTVQEAKLLSVALTNLRPLYDQAVGQGVSPST